jgi:hypothetical protein
MGRPSTWPPPAVVLRFPLEISGTLSGILLHRERRCLGHISEHACAEARGNGTAHQCPQRIAAIDRIHCCSPCRDVPLLACSY